MLVSWRKKKQANPDQLVDIIFSWSIDDIMNNNLYKHNVNDIDDTFPSVKHYLNSFINPLIEETHADLRSNMTSLHSAPVVQVLEVAEDDHFEPPDNLLYELKLEEADKTAEEYEPQVGDLIVLSQVRPKCIDDLHGPHLSYHFALVQGMRDEYDFLSILSSKPINLDNADGEFRHALFAVYLTNLTTNLRIWKALHPGEEPNTGILSSVLRIDPSVRFIQDCFLCLCCTHFYCVLNNAVHADGGVWSLP
ncbi:uncharacterized protein LOC130998148 [Salvia miltiorrhiza]|uniref:uncharacterized protein LOC130998148 n=1 Tax=Salvia miltiorrhiza TaxID=226208 RepID=UPI0025AD05BD|nr:uncharacterized protein LOC130998148 [Salvia miltiorrhiza]